MPLCVRCPRSYPVADFALVDRNQTKLEVPQPSRAERLLRLLERTALLRRRGVERRAGEALERRRRGATWRCPRGHVMPDDFRQVSSVVIALVGPTATTKSSYLGSLLTQVLDRAALHGLGLTFSLRDEPSRYRWETGYAAALRARRAPATTLRPPGRSDTDPLIVRMAVSPPAGRAAEYDLVFFDSAGEVQQSDQDLAVHNPFLGLTDAALLFFTPKALDFAGEYRIPAELDSDTAPGPSRVVGTYTALLGALRDHPAFVGRHPTRDLPVAVVLSKCDELWDLVPRDRFTSLPLDARYLDDPVGQQDRQGELPYALTTRYGGQGIVQAVDAVSRRVSYHAVSAMGCEPDQDGVFPEYRPVNVVEPLLAVLHGLGLVGAGGTAARGGALPRSRPTTLRQLVGGHG